MLKKNYLSPRFNNTKLSPNFSHINAYDAIYA